MYLSHEEISAVFKTHIPWLLGICIDCTGSVADRNFEKMKDELNNFLLNVNRRASYMPGLPSDFITLTAFKKKKEIYGPSSPLDIIKMDDAKLVQGACSWINSQKNNGRKTALYDAVNTSAKELAAIDRQLPYNYMKTVIAITDGLDNDSSMSCSDLPFPNNQSINLAVIGVGSEGGRELKKIGKKAVSTHSINDFSDLFEAMSIVLMQTIKQVKVSAAF